MTVPAYNTDLADFEDFEAASTISTEMVGYTATAKGEDQDEDFPIQGTQHASAEQRTAATGSLASDYGSNITWTSGWSIFLWGIFLAPAAVDSDANGGIEMAIGSAISAFHRWTVGGNDFGRYPYGGWQNFVVDPEVTTGRTTTGTPGTNYRWVGMLCKVISAISKGSPYGIDVIRYGRGELEVTYGEAANYATFDGMATENDSTNNKWGLFSSQSGSYIWKGLMSLGSAATLVDFRDSNRNIVVDNTRRVQSTFNKIEVNNTSSNIEWSNINIVSLCTVSPGQFEAVADAPIDFDSCQFTDLGTFIFQSNSALTATIFRRCGLVTTGGADVDGCTFDDTSDSTKAVIVSSPANAALITDSIFISGGTGHGLEIGGTAADLTLTDCVFTGYDIANPGTAANKAIYVNIATGTVNLTVSGGSGVTLDYHVRSAGATVNVIAGAVPVEVTCVKTDGTELEDIRVYVAADPKSSGTATTDTASKLVDTDATFETDGVEVDDVAFNQTDGTSATVTAVDSETSLSLSSDAFPDGDEDYRVGGAFPAEDTVTIVNSGTTATVTHTGHGMGSSDYVYIEGGSLDANEGVYQITYISTSSYSYTMLSTPGSSPTGTITATFVALFGLSDADGIVATSRIYITAQPVSGWARNTISDKPFYQEGIITGTIDTSAGLTATAVLVSDE
ncbi:MAG: hypothetical protein DRQ42_01635 [Gammaproteobacteria bacterium]|nr:MAG: hypothetical protein DRQ42_01635 [Gammaproteobacteria bacterium]